MRLIYTIFFVLISNFSFSQRKCIAANPLLDFVIKSKKQIGLISNKVPGPNFLNFGDRIIDSKPQLLLKSAGNLYLLIDGTGIVYRFFGYSDGLVCFDRLDSTFLTGYNHWAIPFIYHDTLFSFGGYGFWRHSGQLRYFSPLNHEWNSVFINEEIHGSKSVYYYEGGISNFYYVKYPLINQITGDRDDAAIVISMDIGRKSNEKLGLFSPEIVTEVPFDSDKLDISSVAMPDLGGTFISYTIGRQYLLDFKRNEVFKLDSKLIENNFFFQNGLGQSLTNLFHIDDTLYYTRSGDSSFQLFSIPFSKKDFKKLPYPLYKPYDNFTGINKVSIGILLLSISAGIGIFFWKRRRRNLQNAHVTSTIEDNTKETVFSEIEASVINILIKNSKIKGGTTVDELNSVLGVSRKSLEVQKKTRTDLINRVNYKFKSFSGQDRDLILRVRSDEDKRFYNYQIIEKDWEMLSVLLSVK